MLKQIPKVLLLVALLAGFTASIAPAFGRAGACGCHPSDVRQLVPPGGCHFDRKTLQCVNVSCRGVCS